MNWRSAPSRFGSVGGLLLAGLAFWAVATWPLPRHFAEAIPHTPWTDGQPTLRPIAPGDHLQLLYHFWLGLDALTGHTPFGYNVYEFNLGDDDARVQPDLYYLPFSLAYVALAPFAGHAAGFNAAGLASVLFGVAGLVLLARRFTASAPAAWLAALVAAAFPYRWIALFSGSPTGLAMAFPPWLFYGIDRAVRDRSATGGGLAGLAFFCAFMTDMHTFYFSALAAPFFALISCARAEWPPRTWLREGVRRIGPLLPFVLLALAAVGTSRLMSQHLADSVMASGRTIREVCLYSPRPQGLVAHANLDAARQIYLGVPLLALTGVALAGWLGRWFRRDPAERPGIGDRLVVAALLAALAGAVLLALGAYAPWSGLPIRAARKLIPQYTMIRQTAKIYCLLPALLAPLLALLGGGFFRAGARPAVRCAGAALLGALGAWALADGLARTAPGFCRLPKNNPAYAAIAADDKANAGRRPQALALPLWPGDAHWSSICEYDAMLSRVRMVNGYAPAVPAGYLENVFKKFESLNQGCATDEQLDALLALGVRHLVFHANFFPEQVSPFAPAATLRALVGHPRLALLADDGLTFAFRILPKHPVEHVPHANWDAGPYAAARLWNWEPPGEIATGQKTRLLLRGPVFFDANVRYLLRLGEGSSQPLIVPPGDAGIASLTHPIAGLPDWLQADNPSPTGGYATAISGPVFLHNVVLAAGDLPAPGGDGVIRISPALLFHVGRSAPGRDAVAFDPATTPVARALYGPNLPFPPGVYDVVLDYSAQGAASPGIFRVLAGERLLAETDLAADRSECRFSALTIGAEPLRFEFHYAGKAPVELRGIRLAPATLKLAPAP